MKRAAAAAVCLVMLAAAAPGQAPDAGGTLAERYERARAMLEEQRAEEMATRETRDRLAGEAQSLRERLVANAARVQQLEAAYAATSSQIDELRAHESALAAAFERDRARVARLLAVIQRLDADAPPALVVRSDDSLAAARGAMLLGSMLPPVYEQAAALGRQLRALAAARSELQAKSAEARNEAIALNAARRELSALLARRSREASEAETRLLEIHTLTEEAARETGDLASLLERIAQLRAQAGPGQTMVVVTAQSGAGSALRLGTLIWPVAGTFQAGDPAGPGRTPGINAPQGLWFEAGGAAQAVAPADSEVVFAGDYQKFGQVLILEIAGGYHLLLAGFGRIDVGIGDLEIGRAHV